MKIIFASNNPGKIHELQTLFKKFDIEIIPQTVLDISETDETSLTFVENALLKARHACQATALPAIADDSGLEVAALKGAPGIYSARFAGKNASPEKNIQKLLTKMQNIPDKHRQARFYCVVVYLVHAADPTPLICEGTWEGLILKKPVGNKGFGYDPVFFDPKQNCSAAQLPLEKKNKMSHRGKALQLLIKKLPAIMTIKNTGN